MYVAVTFSIIRILVFIFIISVKLFERVHSTKNISLRECAKSILTSTYNQLPCSHVSYGPGLVFAQLWLFFFIWLYGRKGKFVLNCPACARGYYFADTLTSSFGLITHNWSRSHVWQIELSAKNFFLFAISSEKHYVCLEIKVSGKNKFCSC